MTETKTRVLLPRITRETIKGNAVIESDCNVEHELSVAITASWDEINLFREEQPVMVEFFDSLSDTLGEVFNIPASTIFALQMSAISMFTKCLKTQMEKGE
jgi:hypothetical protein